MEIRQRSLEEECKFNESKGTSAEGYPEKEGTMFEEIYLQ
jgi:hypothetical protein